MEEMWLSKSNGGEGVADGIINLPEEMLHRILGFVDLKLAVQTSILSKKWRYLWTSLPVLDFNIGSFDNDFETFKNFELNFISRRDSSKSIYELRFKGIANPIEGPILMETLNYVLPKGIQKLSIPADYELILPQLFTSQTLKTLELMYLKIGPVAFDLYALMELNLLSCSFGSFPGGHFDPFKGCVNLKWLIIDCCQFSGDFHRFKISAPQLRRLSIVGAELAPHCVIVLSTPKLSSLDYSYNCINEFSISVDLPFVEEVYIEPYCYEDAVIHQTDCYFIGCNGECQICHIIFSHNGSSIEKSCSTGGVSLSF